MGFFLRNMRNLLIVLGAPMALVFIYSNSIQKPQRDPLAFVGAGDTKMAAARAEGQATLPDFIQHLNNPAPDEDHFGVKFRLDKTFVFGPFQNAKFAGPDEEADEFIWANNLHLAADGKTVTGTINDEPRAKGFFKGEPVAIPAEEIVDWGYSKGGVMQGNFTTKVLLAQLSPEEATRARQAMGWR